MEALLYESEVLDAYRITEVWLNRYRESWREAERLKKVFRKRRQQVRRIKAVTLEPPAPKRIRGNKFAFTHKIRDWPRETKLYRLVERLGGLVAKRANAMAKADALVDGDILGGGNSTRKLKAARRRLIPVISQDEFFRAVRREKRRRSR